MSESMNKAAQHIDNAHKAMETLRHELHMAHTTACSDGTREELLFLELIRPLLKKTHKTNEQLMLLNITMRQG